MISVTSVNTKASTTKTSFLKYRAKKRVTRMAINPNSPDCFLVTPANNRLIFFMVIFLVLNPGQQREGRLIVAVRPEYSIQVFRCCIPVTHPGIPGGNLIE